jgi:hypothetical protein
VDAAGEQGGEPRLVLLDGCGQPGMQIGVAQRLLLQADLERQVPQRVGVLDDAAVVPGHGADGVQQVQLSRDGELDPVVVWADVVGDQRGQQAVLATEQRVHRAGRQAGLLGDLVQPGPMAVPGDDPSRGVEQGAAIALLRLRPCHSHNQIITVTRL